VPTQLGNFVSGKDILVKEPQQAIDDVSGFANGATREAVLDVEIIASPSGEGIDAFYGTAPPCKPRKGPEQPKRARMSHPLQLRRKIPNPKIRPPHVPETW
jgi:hypothetical protein